MSLEKNSVVSVCMVDPTISSLQFISGDFAVDHITMLFSTMVTYQGVRQWHIVPAYWLLLLLLSMAFSTSSQWHFVANLIHRDSIFSPYYNPNYTIYDRSELARTSSMARFAFLISRGRNSSSFELVMKDYQAEMLPENLGTLFMARMSFGEPPVPQLVAMDTGSSLLWIQCLPCTKCFDQLEQIFDPRTSSTYMNIPCHITECTTLQSHICDRMNDCVYTVSYADGTTSNGLLVFEQLTIGTSDEGLTKIPKAIIGCGNENKYMLEKGLKGQISGIIGLGPRSESLVHKLGNKFSYCVGNIDDLSYPFNQLAMGESARLDGYSTPMYVGGNYEYLVTLEGISVGDKRLDVTREAFQSGQYVRAGVMIDSGATLTYLATQGYLALKNEVALRMEYGLIEQVHGRREMELCYRGDVGRDLKGFPATTFHLAEGADLVVDVDGMFRQVDKYTVCMAVIDARTDQRMGGLSVIGILAQQYYNVGYDLNEERIYFQRIDCQVLVS